MIKAESRDFLNSTTAAQRQQGQQRLKIIVYVELTTGSQGLWLHPRLYTFYFST